MISQNPYQNDVQVTLSKRNVLQDRKLLIEK